MRRAVASGVPGERPAAAVSVLHVRVKWPDYHCVEIREGGIPIGEIAQSCSKGCGAMIDL
jgi:hypothetical protein